MLDPSIYPEPTSTVEFKETHISRIYLTDHYVYKLKKPLNLGFLDFSTLAKRHHFCREEVRLNSRFSPDAYLGVVALRQRGESVSIDGKGGDVIEYAVQMRRLPESRMLDKMIEAEDATLPAEMYRLGKALHTAMDKAERCRQESVRNLDTVKGNCEENFVQTQSAIGNILTREAHSCMQKMTGKDIEELAELMLNRETDGYVRDGHGDLHTENICMTDPVCIYDCIEFSRRFRVADTAADLAFLVMDLEFRQRRDLAAKLLERYRELSNDLDLDNLLPFYKGYRAWVRGKVDAILAVERDVPGELQSHAAATAQRYFNLALGYHLEPTLIVTAGLTGTGKTTLARSLAQATGATHLRSDILRKELAGIPASQASADDFGKGLYDRKMTDRTYSLLFEKTRQALKKHESVIADASFASQDQRTKFLQLAAEEGRNVCLLYLVCPDSVALSRLDDRVSDASDGRRDIYVEQKEHFDQAGLQELAMQIDTTKTVDHNVQSILCHILKNQEHMA